jgi:acetyl/propionyl-CoA carboxylase alpha subunit
MYQIQIKGQESSHEIKPDKSGYLIDGEVFEWDIIRFKEGSYHIIHQQESFNAELIRISEDGKTMLWEINGKRIETSIQDKFDILLQKMGMDKTSTAKVAELKAPMPGLIVEVKVKEGQMVQKGDSLLILEAMKMENVLKAPADAQIKSIKVKERENVEKNHVLIQFA